MGAWDTLLSWCRWELSKEERRAEYEEVKRRRAELAALASPAEVLEILYWRVTGPASEALFEQRDRVLLALLEEFRGGNRVLAQAILILAFEPTLRALHRRFQGITEGDALQSLVVEALLDAIATYPVERSRSKVALNLAFETRARLFRWLRQDHLRNLAEQEAVAEIAPRREELEAQPSFDLADELRPRRFMEPAPDDIADALRALEVLVDREVISGVERDLIAAANVHGVQLKAWVATNPPELGGMQYEAAKKRLQRAYQKVRTYLKSRRLRLSDLLEARGR